MYKKLLFKFLFIILLCISCSNNSDEFYTIKIGYIGEFDIDIWNSLYGKLKNENITLELIPFSDYLDLNKALDDGYIDLNHFQNYAYFVNETNRNYYYLGIADRTFIASMNMYSSSMTNLSQMPVGGKVAIPNDAVNLSRALKILETIGFIKLKKNNNKHYNYKLNDVRENYLKLEFVTIKANEIYSSISSVDAAIVNYNLSFDFEDENILYYDDPNKYESSMYVNIMAVRREDENNTVYKKIANIYKNRVKELIELGEVKGLIMID